MSDNEYSFENWRKEAGVSNELNRFLRQDNNSGISIKDVNEVETLYKNG